MQIDLAHYTPFICDLLSGRNKSYTQFFQSLETKFGSDVFVKRDRRPCRPCVRDSISRVEMFEKSARHLFTAH